MKNYVRILAVVVAFSMLFTLVAFGEEAAPTTPAATTTETPAATTAPAAGCSFSDVKDTDSAYEAVTALCGLGVINGYPDGSFGPDKSITRAEFSAVVDRAKALGDSADAAKGATMFNDVKADHWATGFINLASQQGIINGMGDGTFAPDANVTFSQAVKMIVSALGYEPQAKSLGGWPSGYLAVAAQKGVTKGVASSKESEPATRASVAKMLYNALDIPLMEQTGFGTDVKFEAGDKLLLDGLDVVKVEGYVSETGYSKSTTPSVKKDEVKFQIAKEYVAYEGKLYTVGMGDAKYNIDANNYTVKVGSTNAKSLLQYTSVAYIKNIDDTPLMAAIAPKTGKNKTLTIKSTDIRNEQITAMPTAASGVAYDFTYYTDKDNNKDDKVTIASGATYYYNGSQTSNTRPSTITSNTAVYDIIKAAFTGGAGGKLEGTVTLLNNTDTDNYNVVFVTEAKDSIVDEVNTNSYRVTAKSIGQIQKSLVFDLEDKDADFNFVKDGKPAQLSDLKKDDVISLVGYTDSNSEVTFGTVTVTSTPVTGKVGELNTADNKVTIGDKSYEYVDYVGSQQSNRIAAGSEGTFYLNANGKIIAVDAKIIGKDVSTAKVLYVTKIASNNSLSSSQQLRGLTKDGEWKTFDLASKVAFNATIANPNPTLVDTTGTINWLTYYPAAKVDENSATLIYSLVSYDVNSDGKINKLDFEYDGAGDSNDSNFYAKPWTANDYDASNKKLASSLFVNDGTVIFNVPADVAAYTPVGTTKVISITNGITKVVDGAKITYTGAVEDDITVSKSDILMDGNSYYGTAYDMNDSDEAAYIVGSGFTGVTDFGGNFLVVDTVGTVLNTDGDNVKKITGFQKGAKVEVMTATDVTVKKMDNTTAGTEALEVNSNQDAITKGSVLFYTKNVKGAMDTATIVFNGFDIIPAKTSSSTEFVRSNIKITNNKLFEKPVGSDTNAFVFGYAYSKSNGRFTLVKDNTATPATDANAIVASFVSSSPYAYTFDGFYNSKNGLVQVGDTGSIETDNGAGNTTPETVVDGDYVFAHLDDAGRITEALVIKKATK